MLPTSETFSIDQYLTTWLGRGSSERNSASKKPEDSTSPRRHLFRRIGLFRKRYESSVKPNASSSSAASLTRSSSTPATSLPQSLHEEEVLATAARQASAEESLQTAATFTIKVRWLKERGSFVRHLNEIRACNNFIRDVVSMRALNGIHKAMVVDASVGHIPPHVTQTRRALHELHRALVAINESSSLADQLTISIRILKSADYLKLKTKLQLQHDYLHLRKVSAVYPLQVKSADAVESTMVLAETVLEGAPPATDPPAYDLDHIIPLSDMLCDQAPGADESFRDIGTIGTPTTLIGDHQLFQDVSTLWTDHSSLAGVLNTTEKFRTYINLAVHIAISYMYVVSMATSHSYPRLQDYRYYEHVRENTNALGPDDILTPYLNAGFGSKPPKKSTREIGGFTDQPLFKDEAMTRLGVLLHQIGCWTILEEQSLGAAKETAKARRNDLIYSAGIPYAEIVDVCLESKDELGEPEAQVDRIYRKVVAPLQKIVDELRWD